MRRRVALLILLLFVPVPAVAQDLPAQLRLPWGDVAPSVDARAAVVRAAAAAQPDERIGSFAARRASARQIGRMRAIATIHAWVDDALAAVRAAPSAAQAAHAAVDQSARVEGVRPLVDGGAVVVVVVPLRALSLACPREGLPWTR